jgi:hypothetical protein
MSLSYQAWYRPSPNLAGAVFGTVGFLLPAFTSLPLWVVLVFAATAVVCAVWAVSLAVRCHSALRADTVGLVLSTPGPVFRRQQLYLPWSQVKKIRVVEHQEHGATVPYLEIVRRAGATPVPAAFTGSTTASGAADGTEHVLLAIRGWLPDRERLAEITASAAPHVRFGTAVPPAVARAEEDRELDRSDRYLTQYGAVGPNTFRFLWRYVFGLLAWCLLGAALLDMTLPDLEAHFGAGRPGVWTAGPEHCGRNNCYVRGDFVSDDGKRVRTNLALRDDYTRYPAGHQVRVVDTGSLDYVYPPGDLGNQWPLSVGIAVVCALPLGFWIWRVPVRSARQARSGAAGPR